MAPKAPASHPTGGASGLSYLIGAVLLVSAGCAAIVMSSLHTTSAGGAGGVWSKPAAPPAVADGPAPEIAVPGPYQSNAELVAEYKALARDLSTLKAHLRRMRIRHHDEAEPPRLGGLPPDRARAFGGVVHAPSAGHVDPVSKQQIGGEQPAAVAAGPVATADDDTIFTSVASFRDVECSGTVRDMFAKAKNPKRLYLGIIEQNEPEDKNMECIPKDYATECGADAFCPLDNIRIRRVRAASAKGPTFGRFVAMLMYRGEKYFMMIDSHNRFVRHWDARFITMYRQAPSKKAVLSHYPAAYSGPQQNLENAPHTTVMCNAHFIGTGFLRMDGMVMERSAVPRLQPFSAAGFLFADAKLLQEVPFDPYLDYLFDGEEILYSVRMWTHGWDIFSPSENVLYHYYYRVRAHKFWSLIPADFNQRKAAAERRIQRLLQTVHKGTTRRHVPDDAKEEILTVDLDKYGLGTERNLAAWYEYAGVDRVNYKLTKNWCSKHS